MRRPAQHDRASSLHRFLDGALVQAHWPEVGPGREAPARGGQQAVGIIVPDEEPDFVRAQQRSSALDGRFGQSDWVEDAGPRNRKLIERTDRLVVTPRLAG